MAFTLIRLTAYHTIFLFHKKQQKELGNGSYFWSKYTVKVEIDLRVNLCEFH